MDKVTFIKILEEGSHKLEYRDVLVKACLENTSWISILLNNMRSIHDENSNFSARTFELVCKKNLAVIIPHLDTFFELLPIVILDGVTRPCSKICELLMIEYFSKCNDQFLNSITTIHQEKIIEAGFDWMITNKPIAIQAYTMQTLYLLGTKYDWIHKELALLIEKDIPTGSTGYKNRGRKVLKAIETNTRLKL